MIYQTPKRSYERLKKLSQIAITLFAFVVLPCTFYLLDEKVKEYNAKIEALSAPLSNATVIEGVSFNKHGRKDR
jgi:putative effector of murein hydrolase